MINIHPTPTSSNISSIAYDPTAGSLYVEFKSGKTYKYDDISPDLWNQFIEAPSVGKFFAARIKDAYKGYVVSKIPA